MRKRRSGCTDSRPPAFNSQLRREWPPGSGKPLLQAGWLTPGWGSLAGQGGAAAGKTGLNAHGRHLTDQLRARTPGLGPAVPHTL